MIYIEILIILIIILHGWMGFRRGFLSQTLDLIGIVISFILSLHYFDAAAAIFTHWGQNPNLAKPIGFLTLWILFQLIFYLITLLIFRFVPLWVGENKFNRFFGIIPGLVKGIVVAAIILMICFVLPVSPAFKDSLVKSPISGFFIKSSAKAENQMEKVFDGVNSLNFFGTVSQSEETIKLDFKIEKFTIDENSENIMINQVNNERVKVGLPPLKLDLTIRTVARFHSIDMAKNGYFSHVDLASKTPADRMTEGGVNYWLAGENIALAPTEELAEIGFMNSPKHRDNILDPKYGRIGVGIIDIGVYGKMVTQNFAE
ncbi:MAG: CvpA family protein [Patescibacteria group bacterium]|nr:CvpA family protein [Patescibacteria group bacterium]